MVWYILVVSLHILAACVWIGGMAFLAAAVLPVLRRPTYETVAASLIHAVAVQFRWIAWAALGLLVATGIANLHFRGYGWAEVRNGSVWQSGFGRVLGVKLVLVALILVISAWHDVVVGPRFTLAAREDPRSSRTRRLRRLAAWIGRLMLILSVAIVALGVMLVRGVPQ
ncbi:MAG TPA: CopD family protein [bacterium]|nr:CopD family protein [bacterium]